MGVATTERTRALLSKQWFPLSHADAAHENERIEIVAVCDADAERAREAARGLGLTEASAFTGAQAMLHAVKPDICSIATRTPGRVDLIRLAIDAGVKAIHSEKPLSQTLLDGENLMEEVQKRGVHFTYGTLRRFMAPYRLAKKLVEEGRIGPLREIVVDHNFKDLLLWSHPHSVDLLLFFGGAEVESVNAVCEFEGGAVSGNTVDCDPRVDFARVRFKSGCLGMITSTTGMNVRLTGDEGAIHIVGNGERVELHDKGQGTFFTRRTVLEVPPAPSGTAQALRELVSALDGEAPVSIAPDEVAMNQRVLWSIVSSALANGATIRVNEANEKLVITGRTGALTA